MSTSGVEVMLDMLRRIESQHVVIMNKLGGT
jgi:hypothetical protein